MSIQEYVRGKLFRSPGVGLSGGIGDRHRCVKVSCAKQKRSFLSRKEIDVSTPSNLFHFQSNPFTLMLLVLKGACNIINPKN